MSKPWYHCTPLILSLLATAQEAVRTPVRTPVRPASSAAPAAPIPPTPETIVEGVPTPAPLPDVNAPMLDYRKAGAEPIPERFRLGYDRLSFIAGDYQPPVEERIDPVLLERTAAPETGTSLYAFVIISGQDTGERMAALAAAGAEPIEFHPYSAYKVKLRRGCEYAVAALPFVRWVGFSRPWQKTAPDLRRILDGAETTPPLVSGGRPGTLALYVTGFESDLTAASERFYPFPAVENVDPRSAVGRPWRVRSHGALERAIAATGAEVAGYYDDCKAFLVFASPAQAEVLIAMNSVHYVELAHAPVADHDQSVPLIGQDEVRGAFPGGDGVIAGVIDSGVDTTHVDLPIFGMGWDLTGDNTPWIDIHPRGHGSHVTGTILGRGIAKRQNRGNAPGLGWDGAHRLLNARLYRGDGTRWGNPLDAFNNMVAGGGGTPGAMVVNGSWHTSETGFGTDAVSVDADAKAFRDGVLWVFAAGNRGSGARTINDPASAKNVLAVASVCDLDWDDTTNTDRGNGAVGLVAGSSSRGPAADNRWKPNLAAPGQWITSVKAGSVNQYLSNSGTSMAAPHVTGVASGLMQHYASLQRRPHFLGAKLMANGCARGGASADRLTDYGFGKVNAYRAHWSSDAPGGWVGGSGYATVSPGVGATLDTRFVPADCDRVFVLTWYIEGAASTGAGNAVKNNVDLYVDLPPYTAGTNTGEYLSNTVLNNIDRITLTGANATACRGSALRLKFHPESIRAKESVHVGYQYVFYRGSLDPAATPTCTLDRQYVRPGEQFHLTTRLAVDSYFGLNTLVRLIDPKPFAVQNLQHVLKDGVAVERLLPSTLWQTIGDVRYRSPREIVWQLKAPPYEIGGTTFRARFWSSNVANGAAMDVLSAPVCVDGSPPDRPGKLESPSHPYDRWSNRTTIDLQWLHGADVGCSGRAGYSYLISIGAPANPDLVVDRAANVISYGVTSNTQPQYFTVRTVDRAGNGSAAVSHKFWVDTTTPVFSSFTIDNGAAYTTSRLVDLHLTASDTWSGVAEMRFSNDGVSWNPWQPYAKTVVNWDLGNAFGGSLNHGPRTVFAQIRDKAANTPPTRKHTIVWDDTKPTGKLAIAAGAAYTTSRIVRLDLSFKDDSGLAQMRFSNDSANWSPWEAYAVQRPNWDLALFGGSVAHGTKTVWCQVSDVAGNVSVAVADDISLIGAPGLDRIGPDRTWTLKHPEEPIVLDGDEHDFLTAVVLRNGATTVVVPLGQAWSAAGRLVTVSRTSSRLYLPKPIEAGLWTVALRNPAGESAARDLTLTVPPDPGILDAPAGYAIGSVDPLLLVSADANAFDRSTVFLSTSNTPSSLAGLIDLEIGDQFRDLLSLPGTFGYGAAPLSAWTISLPIADPALAGVDLYFEAAQVDSRDPRKHPIRTTNAVRVALHL